jgi:uncharacterized membrane protein
MSLNDPRQPKLVYLVMLALGVLEWARAYAQLPAVMAVHFAAGGAANGFAPKQLFFILMLLLVGLSAFLAFAAPLVLASKPPERLNLPNRSYWLAPERREETFRLFRAQFGWFGCAVLFVLLYGTSRSIAANLAADHRFDSIGMFYVIIGFVLFTLVWVIRFLRQFQKIPARPSGDAQP